MQRGSLIIAVLTIALGVVVLLASLGVFPVSDEGFAAPRWVVGLAGGAFLTAGLLLLLTLQSRAEATSIAQEPHAKVLVRGVITVLLLVIFAVLLHWVAFGEGGRRFTARGNMPLFMLSSSASGVMGRLGLIAGAFLVDGLLVLGLVDLIRRIMQWRSSLS